MSSLRQLIFRIKESNGIHYLFILIYIMLFILARYPFYRYFPVPLLVVQDGAEYYSAYRDMLIGQAHFGMITAGYPIFIYLVHLFSGKAIVLYIAQSVVAMLSGLLLIRYVYRYYNNLIPLVCLALAIFMAQDSTLRFETATFPESLIISSLIGFLAFLIGVLNRPTVINISLMCFCAAYLILLKSAEVYIIPIILLITGYFTLIKQWKTAFGIMASFSLPLLLYACYNLVTINKFTILSVDRITPNFTESIGKAVSSGKRLDETKQAFFYKVGANMPKSHPLYIIHNSYDIDELYKAYLAVRWGTILKKDSVTGALLFHILVESDEIVNIDSIVEHNNNFSSNERKWYFSARDSFDNQTIRMYPVNLKKYCSSFINYYLNIKRRHPKFYYSEIDYRYTRIYITKEWVNWRYDPTGPVDKDDRIALMGEYYWSPQKDAQQYKAQYEKMSQDILFKLYDVYSTRVGNMISRNIFWVYLFIAFAALILIALVMSFRNADVILLFTTALIHVGSSMVYTIWGNPLNRYSHATEFIPYLLLAFSPLLWKVFRKRSFN